MNKVVETVKLGRSDVASVILGQSPKSSTYNQIGDGVPFFQGKADFGLLHPVPRVWCSAGQRFAAAGDILISVRAPVGDVNIANEECAIGRGIAAIRAGQHIDPWFLYFAMLHAKPILKSEATGSTFAGVNKTTLLDLNIPFFKIAEQAEIGNLLRQLVNKIQLHQEKCAVLDNIFKVLLHKLMAGEIRVSDFDLSNRVERLNTR